MKDDPTVASCLVAGSALRCHLPNICFWQSMNRDARLH